MVRREPKPPRNQGALGEIEEPLHEEREPGRRHRALAPAPIVEADAGEDELPQAARTPMSAPSWRDHTRRPVVARYRVMEKWTPRAQRQWAVARMQRREIRRNRGTVCSRGS